MLTAHSATATAGTTTLVAADPNGRTAYLKGYVVLETGGTDAAKVELTDDVPDINQIIDVAAAGFLADWVPDTGEPWGIPFAGGEINLVRSGSGSTEVELFYDYQ